MGIFSKESNETKPDVLPVKKSVTLIVLDGFGVHPDSEGNAVLQAKTPFLDLAWTQGRSSLLNASGTHVGLPPEAAGDSETGHLNIGAGQVVYQSLPRINDAISSHELDDNAVVKEMFAEVRKRGSDMHLVGILSAAGVHGHIKHLFSFMEMCRAYGVNPYIHMIMDGRDTPQREGFLYVNKLKEKIAELGVGRIASMMGRFYGMDRDGKWERTKLAYDAMVGVSPEKFKDPVEVLQREYKTGGDDEHIVPMSRVDDSGNLIGKVKPNDVVLFYNFREDRARQLTKAFVLQDFQHFPRIDFPSNLYFATMTGYEEGLPAKVIFPPKKVKKCMSEILADHGKKQIHISETEKYMHVTYFFNGGTEQPHPGEEFFKIPSPNVRSYAEIPEMSALKIKEYATKRIPSMGDDFVLINFANPDMLGHTGDLMATVKANEVVDGCVAEVVKETLKKGGAVVITADHGNCETMVNRVTKEVDVAHTNNPVPFVILENETDIVKKADTKIKKIGTGENAKVTGILADIAPTSLSLIGVTPPESMTGMDLRKVL
jgi:2,3-bisphosphoglycerate-independent phosphoglycerate mutase